MDHMFSVKNAIQPLLLACLLVAAGAVHAQASGQAGGTLSGQSGAAAGQGQALSGQSSSAGGERTPQADTRPGIPGTAGDRGAAVRQGTPSNERPSGKGLSSDNPNYSIQQGTDAGRVSGRNTEPQGVPNAMGASPGSEVGR